jgi:hypothetical protein
LRNDYKIYYQYSRYEKGICDVVFVLTSKRDSRQYVFGIKGRRKIDVNKHILRNIDYSIRTSGILRFFYVYYKDGAPLEVPYFMPDLDMYIRNLT